MRFRWLLCVPILALFSTVPCIASIQLKLDDGLGNSVLVTDGDNDGLVSFSGALGSGSWFVNFSVGISYPALGTSTIPHIDLHSFNLSSGAGTLTVSVTDTFVGSIPATAPGFNLAIGGTVNSANSAGVGLLANVYADASNAPFGTGESLITLGSFGPGGFSGSGSASSLASSSNPYSLTIVTQITHTAAGNSSFDADLTSLPEPASLAIWSGIGIAGLVVGWRRKRTQVGRSLP